MLDLILKQDREKALLASQLLRQQKVREKGYADLYTRSTDSLDAKTLREIARKPLDNISLSTLVVKNLEKPSAS